MGRDPKHDYRSRCIYHITICKSPYIPVFSRITGSPESFVNQRTTIGTIVENQILNFPNLCPLLSIIQYVIMPDHIHFAIFAKGYLPRSLGRYIGMMKVRTGQEVRLHLQECGPIFAEDFHDRILRPSHCLNTICEYIRQNPYRLLLRRCNPDFFTKVQNININGSLFQAYGNLQLLENPFKAPVVIHRSDSESLRAAKCRRWTHIAENGGVLVSPFISPKEKEMRSICEKANGKLILLSTAPLKEREKPAAHNFHLCSEGRLLILAPMEPLPAGRAAFLWLNSIAESISINVL